MSCVEHPQGANKLSRPSGRRVVISPRLSCPSTTGEKRFKTVQHGSTWFNMVQREHNSHVQIPRLHYRRLNSRTSGN
jgi:hypothetical protein